jgi:hypothetical protein
MASRSLPIPLPQARTRNQVQTTNRLPSVRVAIAVFAALLILFGWLHLLLAMELATTDRLIQARRAVLAVQKRDNAAMLLKISVAVSPINMQQRLELEDLQHTKPLFLLLPQADSEGRTDGTEPSLVAASGREAVSESQPRTLLEAIMGELASPRTKRGP